jgi:hypothetical protein
MRKNENGTIFTWLVTDRASGEQMRVDDRTFNPELHAPVGETESVKADLASGGVATLVPEVPVSPAKTKPRARPKRSAKPKGKK